jgi:chromosome transmission fidelity protein 4
MHSIRYAHCEGHTEVCFAEKGSFCTTGEDGDVRIWSGYDDLDATSFRAGDKCSALAYHNGRVYVADELNELKRYDSKTNECLGVLTSFTLPITSIAVNASGTMLVCGAADFELHLVDLNTLKVSTLNGHEAPILSVCFDPLEKYFLSTACDATARFWSVQNLNNVKTVSNLFAKSNDFSDSVSRGKAAWHQDAGLIAIPCEKDVQFYERESWIQKFKITLNGGENGDEFCASILCFSPDGKYVLAATSTQMVYVHSIVNKSLVYKYSYTKKSPITSLAWNPTNQNEIIFCDVKGKKLNNDYSN